VNRITLDIELIDDVVLPRNIATSGTADTHDFIPGSVLLGIFAGRGYRAADQFAADHVAYEILADLFQSGRVRFQDALPVDEESRTCVPVPLSLHRPKAKNTDAKGLYDLSVEGRPDGVQLSQMRSGYLRKVSSSAGDDGGFPGCFRAEILQPNTSYMMRTAINEKTGRAREAQLFGYASLSAGQKFRGAIEFDDDSALGEQVELLLGLLFGSGNSARIRIGRSKNAEYGRARVVKSELISEDIVGENAHACRLLLLSDLAAFDQFGQPTFTPTPQDLGLSSGVTFDDTKCFVRFRSYAPYNAALGKREPERHVIERGSVLTLSGLNDADHILMKSGLGTFRQHGLGQVLVLDCATPMVQIGALEASQSSAESLPEMISPAIGGQQGSDAEPRDPFLMWLEQIAGGKHAVNIDLIDELVREWQGAYKSAHTIFGAGQGTFIGPTRHQWSRIRTEARNNPNFDHLVQALFDGANAICRDQDTDWSLKTALKAGADGQGAMLRMRDILRSQFDRLAQEAKSNPADHLVALCAEIEREIERNGLGLSAKQELAEEVSP
jgi:hypothetical protein